jgi:hypothetical protein
MQDRRMIWLEPLPEKAAAHSILVLYQRKTAPADAPAGK